METLYTASVTATGGRNGHIKSSDGVINFEVRTPKAMGGSEDGFTNPEQLFAAGYSACFDSAVNSIIRTEKLKSGITSVRAEVSFLKDNNAFMLGVELHVNIPGVTQQQADEVVHKAHMLCPYSKATRGNIDVKLFATNNDQGV
jgi:osmotically inducible protein OsmC